MELSYTGSLDRSTRASEHVTVQISIPVRLPGWHVFIIIWNGYVLFFMHVVFVGRLVCSVNMLYMELSYTGSLDRSTRASEHVTVQISIPVRLPGWHVFIIIWNGYVLFFMHVVFVGRLVCSVNMLYMELSYTGSLDRSTRASEHVTVQISLPIRLPGWQVLIIV